jgi:hypothetical protein
MAMTTDELRNEYPVRIDLTAPVHFDRIQLLVRALIFVAFGMIHESGSGLFACLYVVLPAVAAVLITHRGGAGYLERDAPGLISVLEWVIGFYAYMLFVTDTFPLDTRARAIRLRVSVAGTPTVGRALLRLVTSVPHLIVLAFVGLASFVIGVIAAVGILLFERYPEPLRAFQQDVTAWIARLFAYHACLVQSYPPLAFSDATRSKPRTPDEPVHPSATA